ncbi:O-antigen ligase family protein [Patescibacteria group bacterium]|nr:O-antigen ligase family protein [Patescibacteria group bacterium]
MSYTRFLRWTLLIGSALLFFVPFIIADGGAGYQSGHNLYIPLANMFFPFITGKNFAFRIIVELLAGAYILLALREPKYRPRASSLMWAVCAFVVWMGIATIVSVDPLKSFWSNFERMEGYLTILHLCAYFIIVGAVVAAEGWWNRLFQASIASGALMGVYALLQSAHFFPISSQSGPRADGTFGNATYLAIFMLFNLFLTLFMLVRQRNSTGAQVLYGIALVLQFMGLYFTQTRGAFLGFFGGLVIAAIYIAWQGRGSEWRTLRRVSYWGLGVIAVLVIAFFALRTSPILRNSSDTLSRVASISLNDPTTIARFQIWNMAWHGFTESPKTIALGWGQENFNFVFNKHYQPEMYNQEQWFDRAHNQFLDWLIAGGLPAFLLYVSLFMLAIWMIWRSELSVPEQAVLLGLLAAYAFNNLTVFDDIMSSVYFFLILAFVHSYSKKTPARWMSWTRPLGDNAVAVAAPVVIIATLLVVWTVNVPGIARAQGLLKALVPQVLVSDGKGGYTQQAKTAAQELQDFKDALAPGPWPGTVIGYQEVVEQLLQYTSGMAASTSVDPSVKQDTFNLAKSSIETLMQQRSHDARLEVFAGAFLDSFGQYGEAQKILTQALADSPYKQQIMFELGVSYLNAGDKQNALSTLKKAFDEAPAFTSARSLYAAALIQTGNQAEADALLKEGFGDVIVDDARLLQVYVQTKQYDRVIATWQLRIKKDPQNLQYQVGLAAAYYTAGDKKNAIIALKRAEQIQPSLASQIEALIVQIQNGTLQQ